MHERVGISSKGFDARNAAELHLLTFVNLGECALRFLKGFFDN